MYINKYGSIRSSANMWFLQENYINFANYSICSDIITIILRELGEVIDIRVNIVHTHCYRKGMEKSVLILR